LQLRVYYQNSVSGADVEIDRIRFFPTLQPVLSTQLAVSYDDNFEAFDQVTGIINCAVQNQQPVRSCFELFDTLYIVKTGSFVSTQDNNTTEPFGWTTRTVSQVVGTPSVNGVDYGEDWALIAGQSGLYIFNGGEPVPLNSEIRSLWNTINWDYGYTLWVKNDPVNRRIMVGVPLPTPNQWMPNAPSNPNPTSPNVILMMSYREVNSITALMEPAVHVSAFTGKLLARDASRKWTIWQIASPCAALITRPNATTPTFFGNSVSNGKLYQLTEGRTDDDGSPINELYVTSPFVSPELEQALQLGNVRHLYGYMTLICGGSGSLGITVYPDSLTTPYPDTLIPITLPNPGGFDSELPLNEEGTRLFAQFSMDAVGQSFNLSRVALSMSKAPFTVVRGR